MLVALLVSLLYATSAKADQPKITPIETRYSDDGNYYFFATRQDIKAPVWNIGTRNDSYLAPGYWFIAPYEEKTQTVAGDAWVAPHIYDGNGDLVWSGAADFKHWNVFDFDMREVKGVPHLTGLDWQQQRGVVMDSSYRIAVTVGY